MLAGTSCVLVAVIDCTAIGFAAPMRTLPIRISRVFLSATTWLTLLTVKDSGRNRLHCFMSRRTRLALARAAALVILVTGINGVISLPRYEPIIAYAAAILIAGFTGGLVAGLVAAVLAIVFYALLFGAPSIIAVAAMAGAVIAGGGIRAFRKVEDSRPRLSGQ